MIFHKTSSIVSGNFVPLVSGRNNAKIEAKEQQPPKMKIGNGFQIEVRISKENPTNAPSPPKNDPTPTAEFLIGVGNNSAVNKTHVLTAPLATALPNIENPVCSHGRVLKCIKTPAPTQQRPKDNSRINKVAFVQLCQVVTNKESFQEHQQALIT